MKHDGMGGEARQLRFLIEVGDIAYIINKGPGTSDELFIVFLGTNK